MTSPHNDTYAGDDMPSHNADSVARYEVRHAVFNPTIMTAAHSPLAELVAVWERDEWRLVQIIPHHQYESVAVFERVSPSGRSGAVDDG